MGRSSLGKPLAVIVGTAGVFGIFKTNEEFRSSNSSNEELRITRPSSVLHSKFEIRNSAFSLAFLARDFLLRCGKHCAQVEPLSPHRNRLPEIADLAHALDHVIDAEIFDTNAFLHLFPCHRRRDGGDGRRTYRIDRRQCSSPRVLVVVDEHASMRPLHLSIFRGDDLGVSRLQLDRDGLRERPHFLLQRAAHDGDVHVNPFRSGRLCVGRHLQRAENVSHAQRHLSHAIEISSRSRIEVEMQNVGPVPVVTSRVPLIEIDAAEVDEPHQRRQVLYDRKVDDALVVRNRADVDPLRARLRRALHVEEVALRAVRVTLHHHGPTLDVREQPRRDVRVVLKEMTLRQLQIFPEELFEIRQAHFAIAEAKDYFLGPIGDDKTFRAHDRARYTGSSSGFRRGALSEVYSSSRFARTARRRSPPRLMSPRPAKIPGKRRRSPRSGHRMSTYLPLATLPRSTTSSSGSSRSASTRASRSSGFR